MKPFEAPKNRAAKGKRELCLETFVEQAVTTLERDPKVGRPRLGVDEDLAVLVAELALEDFAGGAEG